VHGRTGDRLSIPHILLAALLVAAGVVATLPAWRDIFSIASLDEEYSHIFTVPLVALWLVYVRRARIRRTRPTGQLFGVLLVALGWALSLIGFYRGIQSFWHGGAVLVVVGCILAALGKNVLLQFFPAFLVLVFLVPVPGRIRQAIALPLQAWTASTATAVLDIAGFPVDASGNTMRINGMTVTVAEACNGIRMVFALTLVCYALAFAMPLRQSVRLLILLVSPIAALVCNIIRTLPTVIIYGYCSQRVGDLFHDYSGWAMLPLAFAMLYALIRTLRWAHLPVQRFTLASQ
jgi:exosortase